MKHASEQNSQLFGLREISGCAPGSLAKKYWIAEGILEAEQIHSSLDELQGKDYHQRVREQCTVFEESNNPVLHRWKVLAGANESLRYNLVHAGQLQRALRRVLQLPELPFRDPLGEMLTESDDGKVMNFHVDYYTNVVFKNVPASMWGKAAQSNIAKWFDDLPTAAKELGIPH